MDRPGDEPYAPPAFGDAAPSTPELKKTPVLLIILYTLVSFGLYVPIWFLRRRRALNHLAPANDSVDMVTFVLTGLFAAAFLAGLYEGMVTSAGGVVDSTARSAWQLVDFASRIFVIVASFRVKTILEGHYPERLSAVGTFFLTIFYLQYTINRAGTSDPVAERFTLR